MLGFGPVSLTAISGLLPWWLHPPATVQRLIIVPARDRYLTVIPLAGGGRTLIYEPVDVPPWLKG